MDKNNIGVCGVAGAGKDTAAGMMQDYLEQIGHNDYKMYAFARPLKEFSKRLFGFSDYDVYDQTGKEVPFTVTYNLNLFRRSFDKEVAGMIELFAKNKVSNWPLRWVNEFGHSKEDELDRLWYAFLDALGGLVRRESFCTRLRYWLNPEKATMTLESSPRVILQLMGTEFFRNSIDNDFWTAIAPKKDAIITDVRFDNEITHVQKDGGVVIAIKRPSGEKISSSGHSSEKVDKIQDRCDYTIENDGTLADLNSMVKVILNDMIARGKI